MPTESPLSEGIENTIFDKHLEVPTLEWFDGSADPSNFINQI